MRRAFALLLVALRYLGVFLIVDVGLNSVVMLVHPFNHAPNPPSAYGMALRDYSEVPFAVAAAVAGFFALDEWLSRRSGTWDARREWFPGSRAFIAALMTVVCAIAVFWMVDGPNLPQNIFPLHTTFAVLLFPVTLAGAILGALLIRWAPRRLSWLALVPPLAAAVPMAMLAHLVIRDYGDYYGPVWPTTIVVVQALVTVLGACVVLGWVEHLVLGHFRGTVEAFFAGLWLLVVAGNFVVVETYFDCMCRWMDPGQPAETLALWLIAAGVILAVGLRLLFYLVRRSFSPNPVKQLPV